MKFQVSPAPAVLPIRERNFGLSRTTNIDSTLSDVGWALLPVDESDGKECPSYEDHRSVRWRLLHDLLADEVSAEPSSDAAPFENETSGYWGFVLLSGSLLGT